MRSRPLSWWPPSGGTASNVPCGSRGRLSRSAPEELPKLAEALRRRQRDVHLVATDITSLKTPHAETVDAGTWPSSESSDCGSGYFTYPPDGPPTERLKEIARASRTSPMHAATSACRLVFRIIPGPIMSGAGLGRLFDDQITGPAAHRVLFRHRPRHGRRRSLVAGRGEVGRAVLYRGNREGLSLEKGGGRLEGHLVPARPRHGEPRSSSIGSGRPPTAARSASTTNTTWAMPGR